ncbi:MAG TPA: MFS transporter [Chloroflexota bacterium]
MRTPTRRGSAATVILASLGFVSLGLPEGSLGVAWPSIREAFDLPLDALGFLLAAFATGYFISSAVSGRVLARFGVGTSLSGSCALTGLSLLGYALSPAWTSMVVLGALLGLGAGIIDGGLNTYAAVQHGSRVLNWMHAAFGLGAALGPLLMTAAINSGLGWHVGYAIVALAQLGLALGYFVTRHRFATPERATEMATEAVAGRPPPALLRNPLMWVSALLFFVYVGFEAAAGQWTFSLFTLGRDTPTTIAGVLISAYWGSLTIGRILFGVLVTRIASDTLLRACMVACVISAALIWANIPVLSWLGLALLGLMLAPIFPVLIAETPSRLGVSKTGDAIGLQVAAAVLGGAAIPAAVGVLAARLSLEVVGACLVGAGLVLLVLHEALIKLSRASAPPRSARSRSVEAESSRPGA